MGSWKDSETFNIAGSLPGFFEYFVKQDFRPAANGRMRYSCFAPDFGDEAYAVQDDESEGED